MHPYIVAPLEFVRSPSGKTAVDIVLIVNCKSLVFQVVPRLSAVREPPGFGLHRLPIAIHDPSANDVVYAYCCRNSDGISQDFEIAEGPDDFFVTCHFEHLGILWTGVTVADKDISIWQHFQCRHPGQRDSWQIVLVNLPDDCFVRCDS